MADNKHNNYIELEKQINEYVNLFDLVPCIITIQDKNYKILKFNHEFADKFGAKGGEYCFKAYKRRNKKCVDCPLEKTFLDGNTHIEEQSGVNQDGTAVHWIVKTSPIKNSEGEIVAAMEMSINITQQKMLQKKLKKSEKKYHAIFNNIPDSIFVIDAESLNIIKCNDSAESIYGYTKEEMIKKKFIDLFVEKNKEMLASLIKTSFSLNKVKHKHKDASTLFVNIKISPSEYHGRKAYIISSSNITQSLETEHQLIQASKLTTLGEMATGIAHELNQPLSVIKTASTFIMKKKNKKETIDDDILLTMLSKIDSNVDRASKIINHMRQFSRKSNMEINRIQVNDVLNNALQIFNQQLHVRGIEVAKELDPHLPLILADPNCLEQVFINLILNARDAIEEKWGENTIKPGEKKIILKTHSDIQHVFVEVRDTGGGIPKEVAEQIFEPFFTTKVVGKGTGLGLSISYGIIKDCGGSIRAESGKGNGAVFIIKLPIRDHI